MNNPRDIFYFSRACVQMHQCTYYGGCGENEYWNECGNDCKEDKCADLLNPLVNHNNILTSKYCSAACEQRCQCRPGFFRNDDGKTLIPISRYRGPHIRIFHFRTIYIIWVLCGPTCEKMCHSNVGPPILIVIFLTESPLVTLTLFQKENVSRKASVLTGTVWQMKHTKNAEINAWNRLVLFLIRLDVSVILPVNHDVNVMKDLSVISMVTVLPLDSVRVCTALIMKSILITIIHVMKIVVQQHLVVLLQL